MLTYAERLQLAHSNNGGSKPPTATEVSRKPANKKQLGKLFGVKGEDDNCSTDTIPNGPNSNRFAQTTGVALRAETAYEGSYYFEQVLADAPIFNRLVPKDLTPSKRYFELHFTEPFRNLCGISSVRAVVALNPNATFNLIAQEQAVIVFDPNANEANAKALIYAQIFAFLGLWDEWLKTVSFQEDTDQEDENIPTSLLTERQERLQQLQELLGKPLIDLLAAQTRIITSNHRRILDLLMRKSFYPGISPQELTATTRDEQLQQIRRVQDGKTRKAQKKRR